MVYISIASYGSYDQREKSVIYAGLDYDEAVKKCKKFYFPDPDQNCAWVEIWVDGNKTGEKEIIN